jgi:hypothetical protein
VLYEIQKWDFSGVDSGAEPPAASGLSCSRCRQCIAHVDQGVGENAQPYPALHPVFASIAATVESMPALESTDSAFAAGPPALRFLEPSGLFFYLALDATSASVRDGNLFHTLLLRGSFLDL